MNRLVGSVCAVAGALCAAAGAPGGVSTTDPGLYQGIDELFESRIRLDAGNSQTWKSAFWSGDQLLKTSGNVQNVFENGVSYDFSFSYDGATEAAALDVAGLDLDHMISVPGGQELAGFFMFARSEGGGDGRTTAENLQVSLDGGAPIGVDPVVSDLGDVFVTAPEVFFEQAVSAFTLTGSVTFEWLQSANIQGERFKFSVKPLVGAPIPTPGAAAGLGLLGLGVLRRRR